MGTDAELFARIERLSKDIDASQRAIDKICKDSGCPPGESLHMHLWGVPLFPPPERPTE